MNRTAVYTAIAFLVLLAVAVGGFLGSYERVQKDVRVPPSGEAKTNPYLALERLLGEYGLSVETVNQAAEPDETAELIVLADTSPRLSPEQQDRWRAWVERGGHLVVEAPPSGRETAPIVESLGFTNRGGEEGEPAGTEATRQQYACDCEAGSKLGWGSADSNWVAVARREETETTGDEATAGGGDAAGDEGAARDESNDGGGDEQDGSAGPDDEPADDGPRHLAVSRPLDEGRVTLIDGVSALTNRKIGDGEFAALAVDVATMGLDATEAPRAEIVRFTTERSWLAYVLRHTWPGAVVLGVLVLLALWQSRYRFGPVAPPPPDERRSRAEHVRAVGEFLWHHGGSKRLLEATRRSLLDELERHSPGLRQMPEPKRRRQITDILDLETDHYETLFGEIDNPTADQFVHRIRLMEHYRRQL